MGYRIAIKKPMVLFRSFSENKLNRSSGIFGVLYKNVSKCSGK